MKHLVRSSLIGALVGFTIAVLVMALGVPPGYVFVAGVLFLLAWPSLCVRYYAPRQIARQTRKALDPDWRPPDAATPAWHPVLTSVNHAAATRDWDALASHLSEDFRLVDIQGREFPPKLYVRSMKQYGRIYPDFHAREDVVLADPAQPEVFYVRQLQTGRPRSGPALDITMWSRIELAPCGRRLRRIGPSTVIRAG